MKYVEWFLIGLVGGMGFWLAQSLLHFIGGLIARA